MARCRNTAERGRAAPSRQRGVALLLMLILAGVVGMVLVITVVGSTPDDEARDRATQLALGRAKEALIAYAVTYMDQHPNDVPGYLPCPDLGSPSSLREGAASGSCGAAYAGGTTGVNPLGRLPWYTLDIEPLRDGHGECLWYAVSATFKNNPEPAMLNWDSQGRFQIIGANGTTVLVGATDPDLVVAVIIAPGPSFGGQDRGTGATATPVCGGNYAAANYLDTGPGGVNNASPASTGTAQFVQAGRSNSFNDRLIYVTVRDIWDAIARRTDLQNEFRLLTQKVAECIALNFGGETGSLPWAAPISLTDYTDETWYDDQSNPPTFPGLSGRVPYNVNSSGYSGNVLLKTGTGGRCTTWDAKTNAWWKHWKDHLFYALADSFKPPAPTSCGNCLRVNTAGAYAGIVMFAGRSVVGDRSTDTAKSVISNYLEGRNATNHPNSAGNGDYQSTGVNDTLYCISSTPPLTVSACP